MATVVNKADPSEFRLSVNEPDFPQADWLWDPPGFATLYPSVDSKYWKLTAGGDDIEEMTVGEKATVDASYATTVIAGVHSTLVSEVDFTILVGGELGVRTRAMIQLANKRDNYLVNRIAELQQAMDDMKATTGGVQNLRDAIPNSWLATATRPLTDAITDYKDDINGGLAD